MRWKDAFLVAGTAGVNALPIVGLISFLVGPIIAFQAAIPMKQSGAEIFVADLIATAMLRELGPLVTAIVLAGRSGLAFAAEIGTMKINEEINALTTMGLDPVRFLVVTRVIAAVLMTPLLSVFANLMGLVGGAIVVLSLGYPLVTYVNQVPGAADFVDLIGGLSKAFVFGLIAAGIGCLRGLQTKTRASAAGVGRADRRCISRSRLPRPEAIPAARKRSESQRPLHSLGAEHDHALQRIHREHHAEPRAFRSGQKSSIDRSYRPKSRSSCSKVDPHSARRRRATFRDQRGDHA